MTWAIDQEGRIFFEGNYVARIERAPESDGRSSQAYRVMHVLVDPDVVKDALIDPPVFESRVLGTSAVDLIRESEAKALSASVLDPEKMRKALVAIANMDNPARSSLTLARNEAQNVLRRPCPNDTDGDGHCGSRACVYCGTGAWRQ